jgi:hypothetical protein
MADETIHHRFYNDARLGHGNYYETLAAETNNG